MTIVPFDYYILFAIAFALFTLEILLFSFVLMWFAIGFLIVGVLSIFIPFSSVVWQIALAGVISLVCLLLFREKMLKRFSRNRVKDDFFNEKGVGEVKNSKVFYKGTYWEFDDNSNPDDFKEGEKVNILGIKNNQAIVEKID